MERLIMRIGLTLIITFLYCSIWCYIEKRITGCIINSTVDNIMMLLFIPIIFIATDVMIK